MPIDTEQYTVRPLTIAELSICVPFGEAFFAELELPGRFDAEHFTKTFAQFLTTLPSVIFGVWADGTPVGGLAGMIAPDLFDGRLTAQELFWYVAPAHRDGTGAVRLWRAFKSWSREQGATEIRMIHMVGAQADALNRLYERLGGTLLESCYRIPLEGD